MLVVGFRFKANAKDAGWSLTQIIWTPRKPCFQMSLSHDTEPTQPPSCNSWELDNCAKAHSLLLDLMHKHLRKTLADHWVWLGFPGQTSVNVGLRPEPPGPRTHPRNGFLGCG